MDKAFLSRRAMLAGTAAALASPVTAGPALAAMAVPDPVLALLPAWQEARRAYDDFNARMMAAHDVLEAMHPAVPDALYQTAEERRRGFPEAGGLAHRPDGEERFYYCGPVVERIRDRLTWIGPLGAWRGKARRRAEEIVAEWDRYEAAYQAAVEASGYSEDGPEELAIAARLAETVRAVCLVPAVTLAGFMFKAQVAAHVSDGRADDLLERAKEAADGALENEGMTDTAVALGIVRDLLTIAGEVSRG